MKRTTFLQDEAAIWLKGNLHSHSTFSDGKLTPEQMKEAYVQHGYDFLAVTDHDKYTDTRYLTDENLIMVQGFELCGRTSNDGDIHILFLWDDHFTEFQHGQSLKLPEKTGKASSAFCYEMREKGAYIMLNHPHWSRLTSSEIEDVNPYHAVEVINYDAKWLACTGDGVVFWTEMLYRGCRLWGGGSDDNHNLQPVDSMYSDSFGGWTVVKARDRSANAILEALKSGSFYTSTGPSIYDFYVENDEVHVVCSPCERIYVGGQYRQHQRKIGRHVTEFVTKLKGTETYVRAEVIDAAGRSAYTNPIWLD